MLLNPGAAYDYNGEKLRYPDIRLVYWAGGNALHHQQDINRLIAAWRRWGSMLPCARSKRAGAMVWSSAGRRSLP